MSAEPEPRTVRDEEVTCCGQPGSPHPPRLLALPPDKTVVCEECGQRFRRSSDWKHMRRAHWPRAE